jgi:hypothetical protein
MYHPEKATPRHPKKANNTVTFKKGDTLTSSYELQSERAILATISQVRTRCF